MVLRKYEPIHFLDCSSSCIDLIFKYITLCIQIVPSDNFFRVSIVNNVAQTNSQLSSDLTKFNDWAHKWKMSFNPDYKKLAHEVAFSRKRSETHHPFLMINNVSVKRLPFHKRLGLILTQNLILILIK